MSVEIKQHQPGKDVEDFIQVAFEVFRDDPAWVPPLHMEITDRLTPEKHPFFEHAEVALFTAWKDGKAVGRISAQIDHEHLLAIRVAEPDNHLSTGCAAREYGQ